MAHKTTTADVSDSPCSSEAFHAADGSFGTPAYREAVAKKLDAWIPANGGTEEPFTARNGRRVLYCYNPFTGEHGYIDCGMDRLLSAEEAAALFA